MRSPTRQDGVENRDKVYLCFLFIDDFSKKAGRNITHDNWGVSLKNVVLAKACLSILPTYPLDP